MAQAFSCRKLNIHSTARKMWRSPTLRCLFLPKPADMTEGPSTCMASCLINILTFTLCTMKRKKFVSWCSRAENPVLSCHRMRSSQLNLGQKAIRGRRALRLCSNEEGVLQVCAQLQPCATAVEKAGVSEISTVNGPGGVQNGAFSFQESYKADFRMELRWCDTA